MLSLQNLLKSITLKTNNMKKNLVLLALGALTFASCQTQPKEDYSWIKKGLDVASAQLTLTAEEISSTNMLPRSIRTGYDMDFLCRQLERGEDTFKDSLRAHPAADQLGKRRLCSVYDWTSGFYPGSLWYEPRSLLHRYARLGLHGKLQLW